MSSNSELVQRRGGRSGQEAGQPVTHAQQSPAAGGLKSWHLWMLFGLGWPSILLFFLSLIPSSAKTQGLLLSFGWMFCACWWISTASGLLNDKQTSKQALAFKANVIMAGIGSAVGAVLTASYAYYNWPWLYIAGLVAVAGGVFAVKALDDASKAGGTGHGSTGVDAADAADAGGSGAAAAAAGNAQE